MLKPATTRTHIEVITQAQPSSAMISAGINAERPALWRRALASMIDRLAPLPFLALFFPKWMAVVFLYHLLCDCSPDRRSLGKWVYRLRVVADAPAKQCQWWRAALRRIGPAFAQAAWCLWEFIPLALAYELAALACVLLNSAGKRPEDFLAGTRVITEKAFRQLQNQR